MSDAGATVCTGCPAGMVCTGADPISCSVSIRGIYEQVIYHSII